MPEILDKVDKKDDPDDNDDDDNDTQPVENNDTLSVPAGDSSLPLPASTPHLETD